MSLDFSIGRRRLILSWAALALVATIACPRAGSAQTAELPPYYSSEYQKIVDAAKAEGGKLVIYSSYDQKAWAPVFRAFQQQYPFMKDVKNLDLEGEAVHQRLLTEASRGIAGADVIEVQPSVGAELRSRSNLLLDYVSPEAAKYPPDVIQPFPRAYQYAIAATVIAYNTKILPGPATSIADIARHLRSEKGSKLIIGMRDIKSQFAFTTYYTLLSAKPELWDDFATLISHSKPEGSSGSLVTKLQTGEYAAAVFVTDSAILPEVKKSGGLLRAAIAKDGTPFQGAAIAIPATTLRPNSAKLFIDFMLSEKGQQSILEGGRAAIRAGLKPVEGLYSFDQASSAIPKASVAIVPYEQIPAEKAAEFTKRWNQLRAPQ